MKKRFGKSLLAMVLAISMAVPGTSVMNVQAEKQQVAKEELQTFIQRTVTPERMCMAVITPKEEAIS